MNPQVFEKEMKGKTSQVQTAFLRQYLDFRGTIRVCQYQYCGSFVALEIGSVFEPQKVHVSARAFKQFHEIYKQFSGEDFEMALKPEVSAILICFLVGMNVQIKSKGVKIVRITDHGDTTTMVIQWF